MPSWGELLKELYTRDPDRPEAEPNFDDFRAKYIARLHDLTHRAVIVYGSAWLQRVGQQDANFLVQPGDVHALMEACYQVPERELDLVIHSPGGSGTAAEQMIDYLRTQFDYIRAMLALGCDEIVMGNHSELGPIDPQIAIPVPGGYRFAPAIAILRDFARAQAEIAANVKALSVWTPILHSYAGGLIEVCRQQISFSQDVVARWLERYMLAHPEAGIPPAEREATARRIAAHFGSEESYDRLREHGRPIRLEELEALGGLRIRRLEDDDALQDAVLSVFHAFDITIGARPVSKIVENHLGKRYVKISAQVLIQAVPQPAQPQDGEPSRPKAPAPSIPPGKKVAPNRPSQTKRRRS
jgi:hypothetical protein